MEARVAQGFAIKKRLIFAFRESDMDVDMPEGKWFSFKIIDRVFPKSINSCTCNFSQFDESYEFSRDWNDFINQVSKVTDFTITSVIPEHVQFQPILAQIELEIPKNTKKLSRPQIFEIFDE